MRAAVVNLTNTRRAAAWLMALLAIAVWLARSTPARAAGDTLVLLIQPILSEEQTKKVFQHLVDYLEKASGKKCVIRTMPNFIAYWDTLRRAGSYDLVLDAAHFTDYRVQKQGFKILAKIPEAVSYSLIVPEGSLVLDPTELTGKKVASLGPPSIGAARLNAMFPNPVRQPVIIEVNSAEEGMDLVVNGRVHGAILPTPLVSRQMATRGGVAVVTTTEPIPHMALSAAPTVEETVRERIKAALLNAARTDEGKQMLKGIGFERFDPTGPDVYANQGSILKEYWGY